MSSAIILVTYAAVALMAAVVASIKLSDGKSVSFDNAALGLWGGLCWPVLLPFAMAALLALWLARLVQAVSR